MRHVVDLYLTDEQEQALREMARTLEQAEADVIRELLHHHLDSITAFRDRVRNDHP